MPTTSPRAFRARTIRTLCSGCTRAKTFTSPTTSASPLSSILSSSIPVMALPFSLIKPSSRATARAVLAWSPVTMIVRMPARRAKASARTASGRGGSIMPISPKKVRLLSISDSVSRLRAALSIAGKSVLLANARTLKAELDIASYCLRIRCLSQTDRGTTLPFFKIWVHSSRMTSGAPLVQAVGFSPSP